DVVCTYTNARKQGSIELRKLWDGTAGEVALRVGRTAGGQEVALRAVEGGGGSAGVKPGETGRYFVSESLVNPDDYASSLSCVVGETPVTVGADNSVEVGDGQLVVCTFTNARKQGSIALNKVWDGTAGSVDLRIGRSQGGQDVAF